MTIQCRYCEKNFDKASSHNRHEYYCASKQGKPQVPRKRACIGCIRAKTRCDQTRPRCGRCESRSVDCDYGHARSDDAALSHQNTAVSSSLSSTCSVSLPITPQGNALGTSLRSSTLPFTFTTDSGALPGLSIVLRSMLRVVAEGTRCAPFIHPLQPRSLSMETCQDILQAHFKYGRVHSTLELVRKEHERIWFSYQQFNDWELLSALQALVMYCLLRTTLTEPSDIDLPLLLSLKEVMVRLATLHGMQGTLQDTSDRDVVAFEKWIFDESRRRINLVFRILTLIMNLSDAISCTLKQGFAIVPLPSKDLLWQARTASDWRLPFRSQEYAIHGMTDDGELLKLSSTFEGIVSTKRSWESWCAEIGEIGILVALTAQVFR